MAGNFEDLDCWKACRDLKLYLKNEVLPILPKDEKYDLYSQIRRASRSSTANIAEGWGRYHFKQNVNFLLNAGGSVSEILDHALDAKSWDYISEEQLAEIRRQVEKCIQVISGYIRYLRNQSER